ncbi:hypothetical protein DS745_09110 [Anaerobacillus alkaliphilus]|uniref:DUF5667 domain-containing protein n=1 Tax=Anaerobacillus alkaliphilus TaxID=1548597 RepID=A0A4Q0VVX7_9BACI|nr:DUF5667 domain-containing protein [Anaerobacillus alkaliphilus]RXJ01630.1 hypothetical protein DS745_09110 [Anaerobacillus alkaliphilus]
MSKFFRTSIIATALIFSLGTLQVAADNDQETIEEEVVVETDVQTEEVEEETATEETAEVSEDLKTDETEAETTAEEEIIADTPKLLPGDFLYFIKSLMENVQLALTFDTEKEAELLASFAEERIREATALLKLGEEDRANEIIQKAIEQQELALAKYKQLQAVAEEDTEIAESEITDGTVSEDQEETALDPETTLAANIVALTAALEKVGNDRARQALERNIARALEKDKRQQVKTVVEDTEVDNNETDEVPVTSDEVVTTALLTTQNNVQKVGSNGTQKQNVGLEKVATNKPAVANKQADIENKAEPNTNKPNKAIVQKEASKPAVVSNQVETKNIASANKDANDNKQNKTNSKADNSKPANSTKQAEIEESKFDSITEEKTVEVEKTALPKTNNGKSEKKNENKNENENNPGKGK